MRKVSIGQVSLGPQERKNILEVMNGNQISPGPFVRKFEEEFSRYHDCKYGVMMNSGTDALRIALLALKEKNKWPDGVSVVVPALTFVATVNIVYQCGLVPSFVDVSAVDLNIDVDLLGKEMFWGTRCIIPVHLFGKPAAMNQIMTMASYSNSSRGKVSVIEDSCECMGVRNTCGYGPETGITKTQKALFETSVGSHGDIGCFSTYSCHLIQTGVGGIATTNDEELSRLMRSYMNHGRRSEDPKDRFVFDRIGYSSRPTEFEAAIGLAQLMHLKSSIAKRMENADCLAERLAEYGGDIWTQPTPNNSNHARMMYPIILNDENIDRDMFCAYLNQNGVETRPLFPLLTQPCYIATENDKFFAQRFPVALNASQHGFYVGCHDKLTEEDMAYVAGKISDGLRKFTKEKLSAVA